MLSPPAAGGAHGRCLRLAEAFARLGRVDDAQKELGTWSGDGRAAEVTDQLMSRHVGGLIALANHDPAAGISQLEGVAAERKRLGLHAGLLWGRDSISRQR